MYFPAVYLNGAADFLSVGPAEYTHGQLGPSRAHKSCQAHYLAFAHMKRNVLDDLSLGVVGMVHIPVLYLENRITNFTVPFRVTVGQLASHHAFDDAVFRKIILALLQGLNGLSIPDNRNGICHVTDFVQLMGDNNAGDSMGFKVQHDVQKPAALFVVECGCGLIQNQQLHLLGHGLGNLYQLLFSHAQAADGRVQVFASQSNLFKHFLGLLMGKCPVNDTFGCFLLISQKHVLSHRHVRAQGQLLVDDNNALGLRLLDAVELTHIAVIHDIPAV